MHPLAGQVQLLSVDKDNQLQETLRLKKVHAAYDNAKQKLQVLSVKYGQMGERLQVAESNAAHLREELEIMMMHIEKDFGISESMAQKTSSTSTSGRKHHAEIGGSSKAGAPTVSLSQSVAHNGALPVKAVRIAGSQVVSSLTELQAVQKRLDDENRKICELCATSALLRINRQHTCSQCATAEISGDTDIGSFLGKVAASRHPPGSTEEGADTGPMEERGPSTLQLRLAGTAAVTSGGAVVDGLFGIPAFPASPRAAGGGGLGGADGGAAGKAEEGGQGVVVALGLEAAAQQGVQGWSEIAPRSREDVGGGGGEGEDRLRRGARGSELMEVDRGDGGEKTFSRGAEGAVGAWFNAGRRRRYLLGVCWPTRAEEAGGRVCGSCAASLGADVVALGSRVSCSPYRPAEGERR